MDRTTLLRLYDYLSNVITFDRDAAAPTLLGCNGTFDQTTAWLRARRLPVEEGLRRLQAYGAGCDCEVLLNINLLISEDGAAIGLNMRRCQSCNALLALYQVAQRENEDTTELREWATAAQVPAYLIVIDAPGMHETARIRKIYPLAGEFQLTARQFFTQVLRAIQLQHICRRLS